MDRYVLTDGMIDNNCVHGKGGAVKWKMKSNVM